MNTRNYMAILFLMVASIQTAWGQRVTLHMANNEKFVCNISRLDSITFDKIEPSVGEEHEWVDLELPSGTLWATCNVGANSPEEYGDYFAWGETEPKSDYRWSNYRHCNGSAFDLTKYCTESTWGTVDNKAELEPEDDAATVHWGEDWQMPSDAQLSELINSGYTTISKTTQNGKAIFLITSNSNGKSIFLPAPGYRDGTGIDNANDDGYYWARSLGTDRNSYARYLFIGGSYNTIGTHNRYVGRSVRPVRKQ